MASEQPITIISPDPRFRFSLAKLITKAPRAADGGPSQYEVFRTPRGGVRIEPIIPGEQK